MTNFRREKGFYLTEKEKLSVFHNPFLFLEDEQINKIFLVQNLAHSVLYKFLNPEVVSLKDLLFSSSQSIYTVDVENMLKVLNYLDSGFENTKKAGKHFLSEKNGIEDFLVAIYQDLESQLQKDVGQKRRNVGIGIRFQDWKTKAEKINSLSPVLELTRFVEKNVKEVDFFLHGSVATLDFVENYSDLDSLAIIKNSVFTNPQSLKELKEKFSKIRGYIHSFDKHQHHGIFVFTETDLLSYPETFLPLAVFERAVCLGKSLSFEAYVRDSGFEVKQNFIGTNQFFRKTYVEDIRPTTFFRIKFFLQILQLLPILYLQVKNPGYFFHKKESFDLASKDFSAQEWLIMQKATNFRLSVKQKPTPLKLKLLLKKNSTLAMYLNLVLDNKIPQEGLDIIGESYLTEAYKLSERMLEIVNKEIYD